MVNLRVIIPVCQLCPSVGLLWLTRVLPPHSETRPPAEPCGGPTGQRPASEGRKQAHNYSPCLAQSSEGFTFKTSTGAHSTLVCGKMSLLPGPNVACPRSFGVTGVFCDSALWLFPIPAWVSSVTKRHLSISALRLEVVPFENHRM